MTAFHTHVKVALFPVVCGFIGLLSLMFLAACDMGPSGLTILGTSPDGPREVVLGSRGVGKPAGALEVYYSLGTAGNVRAQLEGPVDAALMSVESAAGRHVFRFNGVVEVPPTSLEGGVVRKAVPAGEYTLELIAGEVTERIPFTVAAPAANIPEIESVALVPPVITPNSDAESDVAEITFRTNQTSTISVDLTSAENVVTSVHAPDLLPGGEQSVIVTGKTPAGEVLADGTYTVTLRAQDLLGNRVEAYRQLQIEAGGEPQIEVVRVDITPDEIILGNSIEVSITVKNVGNVPLRSHGPAPGFTYTTNDTYASVEGSIWADKPGLWRVGVDWDGNSGGGPSRYPFRWGFGKTLMPGEEVTTGGRITILKQERRMWFYAGVLQEGIRIVHDRLGRTSIDVDF